jgi:glutathione S-transferase
LNIGCLSGGTENFYRDPDAGLAETAYVGGDDFSADDITTLVTVDFAGKAMNLAPPAAHAALKRWYENVSGRDSVGA